MARLAGEAEAMPRGQARELAVEIIRLAVAHCPPGGDPWLLADDDLAADELDDLAVTVATRGQRRVRLTYLERVEAATRIIQSGGTLSAVCKRLSLPVTINEVGWTTRSPLKVVKKLLESGPLWQTPAT